MVPCRQAAQERSRFPIGRGRFSDKFQSHTQTLPQALCIHTHTHPMHAHTHTHKTGAPRPSADPTLKGHTALQWQPRRWVLPLLGARSPAGHFGHSWDKMGSLPVSSLGVHPQKQPPQCSRARAGTGTMGEPAKRLLNQPWTHSAKPSDVSRGGVAGRSGASEGGDLSEVSWNQAWQPQCRHRQGGPAARVGRTGSTVLRGQMRCRLEGWTEAGSIRSQDPGTFHEGRELSPWEDTTWPAAAATPEG